MIICNAMKARGAQLWKRLRSPRLTLVILSFFALFCGIACWLPWVAEKNVQPPVWSRYVGLDHPFSSIPFLLACVLLFINTFACTWERGKRIVFLWKGDFQGRVLVPSLPADRAEAFLCEQGFRKANGAYFRYRFALWGGFVLHLGILLLLVSVTIQRSAFDGGSFQLVERQRLNLRDPGAVFDREKGWLAPEELPDIEVGLTSFDAFLHQKGYAPDRSSRLHLSIPGGAASEAVIDRARGVGVGAVTIYQAIPSGLALNLEIGGMGTRSLHLRTESDTLSVADVTDPAGKPARFLLGTERPFDDRLGTGRLTITFEQGGKMTALEPGVPFSFGGMAATIRAVTRWGGFTYSRTPGIALVFAGFAMILGGCVLLIFPAGIARVLEGEVVVHMARGYEALLIEWEEGARGGRVEHSPDHQI